MASVDENVGMQNTPTYSVAITAFSFILVSLVVERLIHRLKKYLKRKRQKPLRKVLDKMTEELMLLGFISLLLTVLQNPLLNICVTPNFARHMLPCKEEGGGNSSEAFAPAAEALQVSNAGRKLLHYYFNMENLDVGPKRQLMSEEESGTSHCFAKGKAPFVSLEVLHQLHLFIFVLAVVHVFYSCVTVGLGFLRLHNWSQWELDTRRVGYDGNADLEKRYCDKLRCKKPHLVGLDRDSHAFVDRHASHALYENRIAIWILCFFQQFFSPVSREDYLIFRVGFLNKHSLGDSFNFRDYVVRSMEVDFKKVIGISWWLWLVVVAFLLLNVQGWYTYFWAAFIPALIILIIGTKQQHIISTLALQAKRHAARVLAAEGGDAKKLAATRSVIDIASAVSPSDNLFWFENPQILLRLIHLVIFQNSFELAIFFWLVTTFGWNSCILGNHKFLIVRLLIGFVSQLMASYSTLPIYALVTQMGSQMKTTVFTKDVYDGLQGWRAKAARNRQRRSAQGSSDDTSVSFGHESTVESTVQSATEEGGTTQESAVLPTLRSLPSGRVCEEASFHPDMQLSKRCQMLFGKAAGHEMVRAAQMTRAQSINQSESFLI